MDVYVYNNPKLMTNFYNKQIQIGSFIANKILPGQEKIRLCLSQKNSTKEMVLNLKDVFFLLSSLCNLISLALLNNNRICHNNKNKILYNLKTKDMLTQARCWNNSFLL